MENERGLGRGVFGLEALVRQVHGGEVPRAGVVAERVWEEQFVVRGLG